MHRTERRRALPELGSSSTAAPVGTPASTKPSKKRKAEGATPRSEKDGESKESKKAKRAKKERTHVSRSEKGGDGTKLKRAKKERTHEAAAKSKRSEKSERAVGTTATGGGASEDAPGTTNSRSARRKAAKRARRREDKQVCATLSVGWRGLRDHCAGGRGRLRLSPYRVLGEPLLCCR